MKPNLLVPAKCALVVALVITGIATVPVHALTVTCSTNKTIECWRPVTFDLPTATDGCCSNITVTVITNYSSVTTCSSTDTRYWLVSDCCTNYTCSQTVTRVDMDPPAVACASNKTVQCNSPWQFDRPDAYDTCCGTNVTYWLLSSNLVSSTACQQVWRGLWQVSDCCSNYSTICTQLVTVADMIPPAITCVSNKTIQCGSPLVFDLPSASDDCCGTNVTVTFLGSSLFSSTPCQKIWAGRWQAFDCCSNLSTICTQFVAVVDSIPPYFTSFPSNKVLNCACPGGSNVVFTVTAADNCDSNITVICTPPSGSFFPVGTHTVSCTASDTCGNATNRTFTITILNNCPSNNCISFSCPPNLRVPCEAIDGTVVNWTLSATNNCVPGAVVTWSEPPSGNVLAGIGTYTITCYASNTADCEVKTCTFTVEVFPRGPRLNAHRGAGTFGTNRLFIDYPQSCGEFAIEWIPGVPSGGSGGGSDWSPIGGLPTGSWSQPNQTNNIVEKIIGFAIPDGPTRPDAALFRLSTDASVKTFPGLTNPPSPFPAIPSWPPRFTFAALNGGSLQISNFNNSPALLVDDRGIVAFAPSNSASWTPLDPDKPPGLHRVELFVVGYINSTSPPCFFPRAFDTAGQLVDAAMATNVNSSVTLRSLGHPIQRVEISTEPGYVGGLMSMKGLTDYAPFDLQLTACLDFRGYPTGIVANPWMLPGHTVSATNFAGSLDTNTRIEAGPDGYGNGYHVEHTAVIQLTTNCCRYIRVELIKYASAVLVTALDEVGTELASYPVTETGTPVTVDIPPATAPICKIVVTSPDDQTRILSICCLPTMPPPPPPTWCLGTNSNPLAANCNSNVTWPVSFLGVGGVLGPQYIFSFWHTGYAIHPVLDLGTETVATLVTPCNKVVLEVISENANSGMELEAADEFGFTLSHEGPLDARSYPQTIVLTGAGIKTVRFKCPGGQGSLVNFYLLPQ